MANPGPILRELHRLRKHIKDLESKIEQGPRAQKSHHLSVSRAEEALKNAQEAIKQQKVKIHEREVSIKATQGQIAKFEKTDISSKKEYDALRAEIAQAGTHIRALEDEILDAMTAIEDKTKELPPLEKTLQKAKADLAQFEKDREELLKRFADERTRAQSQLTETETNLDEVVLALYLRQVQGRGEDALAGVEGRICSACYTEVTPQMVNDIARGVFAVCKSCGRILYKAD